MGVTSGGPSGWLRDRLELVGPKVPAEAEPTIRLRRRRSTAALVQREHAVIAGLANSGNLDPDAILGRVVGPVTVSRAVGVQAYPRPGICGDGDVHAESYR